MNWSRTLTVVATLSAMVACTAQSTPGSGPGESLAARIAIKQNLDSQIPLDLKFKNESGQEVSLGSLYRGKPVILSLIYYKCPMLCNQVLNGLLAAMKVMKFTAGSEFDVVLVSIDPRETPEVAAKKKEAYIESYNREGAVDGWHFLTGKESDIQALADVVGFQYAYDEKFDQYAHAAAIMVTTPRGKLSKYFYGIEYSARDLRLALVEASENRIGTLVDAATLYCFIYDPSTGSYGLAVFRLLQAAGILTLLILGTSIVIMVRKDKRRKSADAGEGISEGNK